MIDKLVPVVIEVAQQYIDAKIAGEDIGEDGIKAIQSAKIEAEIWLTSVVAGTTNTYDDDLLEAFITLAADTLQEAGEAIPELVLV